MPSSINRYENDDSSPSYEVLLKYADYFDVSLDYLFGRCDTPEGQLRECTAFAEKNGIDIFRHCIVAAIAARSCSASAEPIRTGQCGTITCAQPSHRPAG